MPEPLQIQPIDNSHAENLAVIHAESFGHAGWSADQFISSLMLHTTHGWLAFSGDEIAGFILCQIVLDQAEILTVCVRPSYRRQKSGAALLKQMIDFMRDKHVESIFLDVAVDNQAAINLYQKLGFQITGKRVNYYQRASGNIDAILFTLPLQPDSFASRT